MVTLLSAGRDVCRGLYHRYSARTPEKKKEAAEEWVLGATKLAATMVVYIANYAAHNWVKDRGYQLALSFAAFCIYPTAGLEAIGVRSGLTFWNKGKVLWNEHKQFWKELEPVLEQAAELGKQNGLQVPDRWWENRPTIFKWTAKPKLLQIAKDILKKENKSELVSAKYNQIRGNFKIVISYLFLALVSPSLAVKAAHANPSNAFEEKIIFILDPLGVKKKMKKFSHWLAS